MEYHVALPILSRCQRPWSDCPALPCHTAPPLAFPLIFKASRIESRSRCIALTYFHLPPLVRTRSELRGNCNSSLPSRLPGSGDLGTGIFDVWIVFILKTVPCTEGVTQPQALPRENSSPFPPPTQRVLPGLSWGVLRSHWDRGSAVAQPLLAPFWGALGEFQNLFPTATAGVYMVY